MHEEGADMPLTVVPPDGINSNDMTESQPQGGAIDTISQMNISPHHDE